MFRPSFWPGYLGSGFIIAMTAPTLALALPPEGSEGAVTGHHYMYGAYGMGHGPLSLVLAVIAIALVVMLVMRFCGSRCTRHHHPHGHGESSSGSDKSALDMLKVRFACGEIDEEEFKARKKVLEE